MERTYNEINLRTRDFVAVSILSMLMVVPFLAALLFEDEQLKVAVRNTLAAIVVLVHGVFVVRLMWGMERSLGLFPLGTCFFAVQHAAFGLGGFLLSISDDHYLYGNDQGTFPYSEAMLPMVLAQFVAMSSGLLGVWLATRRARGRSISDCLRLDGTIWSWQELRAVCLSTLFLQAVVTMFLMVPAAGIPRAVLYPVQVISPFCGTTFIFWGMCWKNCSMKWMLAGYAGALLVLGLIRAERAGFLQASVLFFLGLLISGVRVRIRPVQLIRVAPLIFVMAWCFVKAEDMRSLFTRGTPDSMQDAAARLGSLTDPSGSDTAIAAYVDAVGIPLNRVFRIASRLFEVSAMDVISRTPTAVPYWGWQSSDTTDLLSALLPVKLNSGAAINFDEEANVLLLHDYGWTQVSLEGSSMPVTLLADSWRRFSWWGVFGFFTVWGMVLGATSRLFRDPRNRFRVIFGAAMISTTSLVYSGDVMLLVASTPRRLLMTLVFVVLVQGMAYLVTGELQRRGRGSGGVLRPGVSPTALPKPF